MRAVRTAMAAEGYGVPHAHIHLVPFNGPGQLEPNRRFPATDDELHSAAQTLRTVLQDLRVLHEIQT